MTEQEKFEAWVKNPHMLDKSTSPDDCGEYTHPWTVGAWKGWQAAIASRKAMEWQPIETAPKTSKAILVYCEDRKNTYVANWGKVGGFFQADGWRHFGGGGDMIETPTHWMPLPPPPKE